MQILEFSSLYFCLVQYFGYESALHAVCNAHLVRELQGVIENKGYIVEYAEKSKN